ncbi:MAG TPA: NAD(P)H-binding protein [Baekduia sp.]|uniref:NAD(P)H-binding protein n=1 Tax=Baekduia sp. TaxID=2600305 RepID=UPI002C47643F|nr:NAD(P)H-binding protein [Baekduia sp.]HMJ34271.1 NAD(P)H-binding protein [Baekduia sp.]
MKVAVTGASGQLGRLIALQLLECMPAHDIVLVTRRPHALADLAERGADVRYGDFDEPESLAEALKGPTRMVLISTNNIGERTDQHRAAIAAAAGAGIRHVTYTSLTNPCTGHPTGDVADEHRETEEALMSSGMAWTILRYGAYADLQVPLGVMAVRYGKLVTNAGQGRIAPISRQDCAAAAVAVLLSDGHEGRIYDVTGPEALSQSDIAALVSEVSGRPVEVVAIGDRRLVWGLTRLGAPKAVARAIVNLGVATRENYFDLVDPAFELLTGRRPASLRDVLVGHRGELLDGD